MDRALEIIRDIKNHIGFQSADDEVCAHYTLIGNTLVRIATNEVSMKVIRPHLTKLPKDLQILSIVFSDKIKKPKTRRRSFAELFFNPEFVTDDDIKCIIMFFQKLKRNEVRIEKI